MRIHPLGFELIELGRNLSDKEMDEMVAIIRTSLANEWMFQLRIRDLSYDKQDAWIREFWLNDCLTEPRFRNFAIRDLSAGVLVGWTGLQCPAIQTEVEKQQAEQKRVDMSNALGPEGQAFLKLFHVQAKEVFDKNGYDPEKHFHKRNSLVHADYQRRGLGTWLTEYANEIADQGNASTFVLARPTAWKMLHDTGFKFLDDIVFDTSGFGGDRDVAMKYFRRDPPSN